MFYLEVNLEVSGGVKDVKIHHEGQGGQQVKCKAFTALTSLELDLTELSTLRFTKDPLDQVQHSPVGYLEKRRGGHPMKLTYFVSPYDLLDPAARNRPMKLPPGEGPLTVGTHVSVCMESSSANKLQIQPLVTISRVDFEKLTMVEVTPLNWRQLSISLEHPLKESMASVEIDLSEPDRIEVKIYTSSSSAGQYSEIATKVFQRCLSIPVTMRTLIKQWSAAGQQQTNRHLFNGGAGGTGGGSGDTSGGTGDTDQGPPDLLDPDVDGVDGDGDLGSGGGGNGSGNSTGMMPGYGDILSDSQGQPTIQPLADPGFDATAFNSSPLDPDLSLGGLTFDDLAGKGIGASGGLLDTAPKVKKKKRKASELGWPGSSPKRKATCDDMVDSSGDDDSTSLGTPTSREASEVLGGTPTSGTSGLDFPAVVDLENSVSGLASSEKTSDNELEEVMLAATGEMIDDAEDAFKIKAKKKKPEKERTANDILMDLENKNLVPPSVSITPITGSNFGSVLSGMGLDRRPGIEIIPITSSPPAPVPTSITITPIPKSSSDDRSKDRKKSREGDKSSSKSSSSGSSDKKRKRKREESPMGPPEKIPPKNDPLSKRVTVSIEPAESSPASPVSAIRKFTSSPTGGNSSSSPLTIIPTKGSPGPSSKTSKSSHQSPKHSPAYSPKSNLISSPKTSSSAGSPKQSSNSSSSSVGKPSLTALKTAVSSPSKEKSSKSSSSSSSKSSSSSSSSCSDKSGRKSPKMKSSSSSSSSSVKSSSRSSTSSPSGGGGPPTGSGGGDGGGGGGGADSAQIGGAGAPAPSGGSDSGKASSLNSSSSSSRNRKGSLSDIVDKLKSAQTPGELSVSPQKDLKKDRDKKAVSGTIATSDIKTSSSTPPSTPGSATPAVPKIDGKSGEYMVKPSSDGMKITINKTKTRDKLKERMHSGSKPGAATALLSKKLSSAPTNLSSSKSASVTSGSGVHKKKPEATGLTPSKISKDKTIKGTSASLSSAFLSSNKDKINPANSAGSLTLASNAAKKENAVFTVVESGLVKALDTKFQIPKLSARANQLAPSGGDKTKPLSLVRGPEENPPQSPSSSVSVHIVPSLRLSPRRSPVISEDDLMDEALVGGK
ncbi:unnamed protein product [Nesidiocoris tenuis]|uniref:Uncharacterized protein n=1 Tax=Nesidiocoris tenuis TaxID=355587 RepID=A0A6H5HN23_9HEMI|nr:unnamed protein product [Nesidiocoris tenuis]